jgi:hypothetical protein
MSPEKLIKKYERLAGREATETEKTGIIECCRVSDILLRYAFEAYYKPKVTWLSGGPPNK